MGITDAPSTVSSTGGLKTEETASRVLRGAFVALCLKVAGAGLSFIAALLLARLLGAAGYGIYSYSLAWVGLLAVPAGLGMQPLVLRLVASHRARSEWGLLRGILHRSGQLVLVSSCVVTAAAAATAPFLVSGASALATFRLGLLLLPLVALGQARAAVLQGLERILSGQLPDLVLRPLVFLGFVLAASLSPHRALSAPEAMVYQLLAAMAALLFVAVSAHRRLPPEARSAAPEYRTRSWIQGARRLLLLALIHALNGQADLLVLGCFEDPATVGVYAAAVRCVAPLGFIVIALDAAFAPVIARLHAIGDRRRLEEEVIRTARAALALALAAAFVILLCGRPLLSLFGSGFERGLGALSILCLGQLAATGAGSVGTLLLMTGHEKETAIYLGGAALVNLTLNVLLIPCLGMEGAACASAVTLILLNVFLVRLAWMRLRIAATALGKKTRRGSRS